MFLGFFCLFFAAEGADWLTYEHVGRRAAADAEIREPRPGHPSCPEDLGVSTSCLRDPPVKDLLSVLPSAGPEKLRPPAQIALHIPQRVLKLNHPRKEGTCF